MSGKPGQVQSCLILAAWGFWWSSALRVGWSRFCWSVPLFPLEWERERNGDEAAQVERARGADSYRIHLPLRGCRCRRLMLSIRSDLAESPGRFSPGRIYLHRPAAPGWQRGNCVVLVAFPRRESLRLVDPGGRRTRQGPECRGSNGLGRTTEVELELIVQWESAKL